MRHQVQRFVCPQVCVKCSTNNSFLKRTSRANSCWWSEGRAFVDTLLTCRSWIHQPGASGHDQGASKHQLPTSATSGVDHMRLVEVAPKHRQYNDDDEMRNSRNIDLSGRYLISS
jgi:hypothetical protein